MRQLLHRDKGNGRWTHSLREEDLPDWVEDKAKGIAQADKFCRVMNAMESLLKIVPKEAKDPIPFRHNAVQLILASVVLWCWALQTPCYMVVPKARQMGVTTWFSAYFFTRCVTEKNFRSMVVSHVAKTSLEVFRMARTFERELPEGWQFELDSKSKDLIAWTAGSKLQIGMIGEGGGDALGKGFTLNGVHCTEVANWGDRYVPKTAWASLGPTLVEDGELLVGYESTGKGRDPMFHATWVHATQFGFIRVFLPWYKDPQYALSVSQYTAWVRKSDMHAEVDLALTKEELEIQQKVATLEVEPGYEWCVHPHMISLEQFLWRRMQIASKCFGDVALFDRYYPSTWPDAFRVAGDSPFGNLAVQNLYSRCKVGTVGIMNGGNFYPNEQGEKWAVEVWAKPARGARYVVAVDPSDGTENGDPAAAYVIRYWKGKRLFVICAAIHGQIDEDTLADQAVQLAMAFNDAKLVIEKNRPNCVMAAKRIYRNLFRHRNSSDPTDRTLTAKRKPGFHMNKQTRPACMALFKELARDDAVQNFDAGLPEEVEGLENKAGRWEAKKGAHDDRVMTAAMGLFVAYELAGLNKTRPRPWSSGTMTQPKFDTTPQPEVSTEGYETMLRNDAWEERMGVHKEPGKNFHTLG